MSDDSEIVEDTEKGSLAEVTDDSCTVEFIEIVPLDRASDDYHIDPVVIISLEDLQDINQELAVECDDRDQTYSVKQESADESEGETSGFTIEVSSMFTQSSQVCKTQCVTFPSIPLPLLFYPSLSFPVPRFHRFPSPHFSSQ